MNENFVFYRINGGVYYYFQVFDVDGVVYTTDLNQAFQVHYSEVERFKSFPLLRGWPVASYDSLKIISEVPRYIYVVFLGGNLTPNRFGEDHEIVVVAAISEQEAKEKAKLKWAGVGNAHVDGLLKVTSVDGYEVKLTPTLVDSYPNQLETNWNKLNADG